MPKRITNTIIALGLGKTRKTGNTGDSLPGIRFVVVRAKDRETLYSGRNIRACATHWEPGCFWGSGPTTKLALRMADMYCDRLQRMIL